MSVRGPQRSGMGPADHTEFLGPQIYTLTTGAEKKCSRVMDIINVNFNANIRVTSAIRTEDNDKAFSANFAELVDSLTPVGGAV